MTRVRLYCLLTLASFFGTGFVLFLFDPYTVAYSVVSLLGTVSMGLCFCLWVWALSRRNKQVQE